MDSFNLGSMYPTVASGVTKQAAPQAQATGSTGVPTWNDLYKEYTNQDWFKQQQSAYGGRIASAIRTRTG